MRAAIIGLGVIGKVHFDVLARQGENVVALCDIDAEKLVNYTDVAKYSDYKEMLRKESVDVVHVCTPHYLHAEMVCFALNAGVNVLCEKPLCINENEIRDILAAAEKSEAILGVCLQNRYNRSTQFVKEYLADKKIDFASGRLYWHRDAAYYGSADWRGKWATEGGGVLINQALHTLDLLQWLCGQPTKVVGTCTNISLKNVIEVEDTAYARFEGQTEYCIFATNTAIKDLPVQIDFLVGDKTITLYPDKVTEDGVALDAEEGSGFFGKASYGTGHEKLIAHFYQCVANGQKFWIDGNEGAKVVRDVLAIYRSNGSVVNV